MNLTEQWKKGELEAGWYYVLLFSNEEYITFIDGNWVVDDRLIGADIKEVLAPVPSYEEWQQLVQDYSEKHNSYLRLSQTNHQLHKFLEEFNALDVAKENQQLKELLKECRGLLDNYNHTFETKDWEKSSNLITKIDNAIGEKK